MAGDLGGDGKQENNRIHLFSSECFTVEVNESVVICRESLTLKKEKKKKEKREHSQLTSLRLNMLLFPEDFRKTIPR